MTDAADNDVPRFLINESGEGFREEIAGLRERFQALPNAERIAYRDANAKAIALLVAVRILVVAGPGAGKSHLFRARIKFWLAGSEDSQIYVSSFVRKLVHDLQEEIAHDRDLTDDDRTRLTISTIHTLARSLVERSGGTAAHPLRRHVQVIAGEWEAVVWDDVLLFKPELSREDFPRSHLVRQFHTEELEDAPDWIALRKVYGTLSRFYNAVGFADMIVLAREAVDEQPALSEHLLWIVDEYQDLNAAEDHLIRSLTARVEGLLIAGDDEQAIYQQLKASLPEIIISYYEEAEFANGMLPFCSRCSYYVCLAASAFIQNYRTSGAIDKVFLPVKIDSAATKVQIVATFQPTAAVDYIAKFIEDRRAELDAYTARMRSGEEVDPYLLVLTPQKRARFYQSNHADQRLRELLSEFAVVPTGHSPDYRKVATYCAVARDLNDNFAARKVLHHEGVPSIRVHELLQLALSGGVSLTSLLDETEIGDLVMIAEAVWDVVQDDDLEPTAKAAELSALVSVADQGTLASELAADPIGAVDDPAEEEAEEAIETAGDVAAVEMMTMFQSKGLSAQHVIIIGCDNLNLARTAALTFFVGLTRARKSLHLIASMRAGGCTGAADYLLELPPEFCDYVEYKKTERVSTALRNRQAFIDLLARWGSAGQNRPRRSRNRS